MLYTQLFDMSDDKDIDSLFDKLFEVKPASIEESLEDLFDQRLKSLKISKTTALEIMGMPTRTLNGILTGEQKVLDYTQIIRLSNFLGVSDETIASLYFKKLKEVHEIRTTNETTENINFLNENFNLAELRKVGLITSITDYKSIISSICSYFGLRKLEDYSNPKINIAFSAGKKAKMNCSINNWIFLAEQTCIELKNPNPYSREKLIDYFPQIRWYCTDVDNGLISVINYLFQIGITVVFIPSFPSMHIRGATFCVNNKPCIAITDYRGFYPTLWFALIHELYHVLFDWSEILISNYHLSLELNSELPINSKNEIDANDFARKYLFSKEKSQQIEHLINDNIMVKKYSFDNHVDPSFIYVFSAFDADKSNKTAWGRANLYNPKIDKLLNKLQNPLKPNSPFEQHKKNGGNFGNETNNQIGI